METSSLLNSPASSPEQHAQSHTWYAGYASSAVMTECPSQRAAEAASATKAMLEEPSSRKERPTFTPEQMAQTAAAILSEYEKLQ